MVCRVFSPTSTTARSASMRLDDANTGDTLLPVVPADRDYEIADHTVTTRFTATVHDVCNNLASPKGMHWALDIITIAVVMKRMPVRPCQFFSRTLSPSG